MMPRCFVWQRVAVLSAIFLICLGLASCAKDSLIINHQIENFAVTSVTVGDLSDEITRTDLEAMGPAQEMLDLLDSIFGNLRSTIHECNSASFSYLDATEQMDIFAQSYPEIAEEEAFTSKIQEFIEAVCEQCESEPIVMQGFNCNHEGKRSSSAPPPAGTPPAPSPNTPPAIPPIPESPPAGIPPETFTDED